MNVKRLLSAAAAVVSVTVLASQPQPLDAAPKGATPTQPRPFAGLSGRLKAALVDPGKALEVSGDALAWRPLYGAMEVQGAGATAPSSAGLWRVEGSELPTELSFITPVRFDGSTTHLNGYQIGTYPARAAKRGGRFAPPERFIEVTRENQDHYVSEHFQLRQFLTKDQANVWPKYLPLDLRLVDKLELVLQELNASGVKASRFHVMSGYRTPRYNGPGGNGRAKFSRHTYGDAADVWVDEDGDGQMDDLNGDGRVDIQDSEVIRQAAERVEKRYPELVGGAGVYRANRHHGPFAHIDVGGNPGRWSR